MRKTGFLLCFFLLFYGSVLAIAATSKGRRHFRPGERRCFDDWCVSALTAEPSKPPSIAHCLVDGGRQVWIATIEVSSDAKRVRQRARDAAASLEDQHGHTYDPCAAAIPSEQDGAHFLQEPLEPGERFRVHLPFLMPVKERPSGVVIRHGYFPEVLVVGADQSFFRANALSEVQVIDQ